MTQVFLSYAREDVDAARRLAQAIGAAGHEVWWDEHIHGGSRFTSAIDQALKNAEAVIVLWSPASVESAWVQDEAGEGRDSGRLVPVLIGETKPPLGFRQFQSIDLSRWNGRDAAELHGLMDAIEKIVGKPGHETDTGRQDSTAHQDRVSICVLPFVNMSGDPEQEYFSDGISEDIITDLSKVSALRVIARNSAFNLKGRAVDIKEVAQMFAVSYVLEGSVRKAGARVRITAQLIDGKGEDHVWADRYDRDLTDIFAIQDEISKAIVAALQVKLLPEEKKAIETRGTSSVEAYNLYLMARQQLIDGAFGDPRRDETIVRICQQATVIDPNLAEVRCVKARYFEEEGRQEDADREIAEALKLDPESWEVNREAARMMFREGRILDAAPYFEKAAALMDGDWHNASMLMSCYHGPGDEENLRRAARMTLDRAQLALTKDPTNGAAIAVGASALARFGETDRAKEWIQRGLLLDPDNLSMRYNLACALIMELHDTDAALDVLEPFFEEVKSPIHVKHLTADPDLDSIRDLPRFKTMLAAAKQRIGMTA
jgi:adenylate cyclase